MDSGQPLYDKNDEKYHLHVALSRGSAIVLRDEAALRGYFSGMGPTSGKPSLTALLEAIARGELRIVKREDLEDVIDAEDA